MQTIILADGAFPKNERLHQLLHDADYVVCCDGATKSLLDFGREPDAIVGDMDTLSEELKLRYKDRIYPSADQETNDLTKAFEFCLQKNFKEIAILGATGKREDHTLGNISLLADYALRLENVNLLTDYGRMDVVRKTTNFACRPGRTISIFSLTPDAPLTVHGLKYPIENRTLTSWWQATLNETLSDSFRLELESGCFLVYQLY